MPLTLPRIMGHRGAAALAPENTLPSLAAARAAGCRWVEFDVMLSADGAPVVHHDLELGRREAAKGPVAALSLAELSRIDAGLGFTPKVVGATIPSLADWLGAMAGLSPNLEIKPAPGRAARTAEAALAVAADHRREGRPGWDGRELLVSSFEREALAAAQAVAPEWPRGLIADSLPEDWRQVAESLGLYSLHLNAAKLLEEPHAGAAIVAAVKSAGLAVAVYTVNDAESAERAFALDVDCVITDAPDLLMTVSG